MNIGSGFVLVRSVVQNFIVPVRGSDFRSENKIESPNKSKTWNENILSFCGKGMKEKLGEPIVAEEIVGEISDYFKIRYGLAGRVIAATGDNPSSFAGLNIGSRDICLSSILPTVHHHQI